MRLSPQRAKPPIWPVCWPPIPPLPVIGVPIKTSMMGGLDSLLSMVQMPKGIPVACVAVDGADNAAILAAQMLALSDEALSDRLVQFKAGMAAEVEAKDHKIQMEEF